MAKLNIGDRVLECIKWTPSHKGRDEKLGEGVVTLIVEEEDRRKMRVVWQAGQIIWHLEKELVNIDRVIRYNEDGR